MTQHADKLILASGAMDAVGKLVGAKGSYDHANYEADQLMADAEVSRGLASVTGGKIRKAGRVVRGQARAGYGASGVAVDSGSALAVQEDITRGAGEDALMELLSGNYRAASMEASASARRMAGRNAVSAGIGSAGKSMLSAAAEERRVQAETNRWRRMQAQSRAATMTVSPSDFDFARYEP
jgi:hypothetical protein